MLKIIHCVPLQVGLQQVSGVLLVNNSSDDVRGLVMKSFITYDDVLALVSHSKTLVIASESRGPQREHLTKASLDTTAMNVWFFNLQLRIYMWFFWRRLIFFRCILEKMNALEEVPFQTTLGPLEEEVELVTAPDITVPDCHQILRDTEVTHPSEPSHFWSQVKWLSVISSLAVICLTQGLFRI